MDQIDPQLLAALLQQIQGAQAPQRPDPLASMSPEQIAQYAGMGSLEDRAGMAQQQMARADALRNYEAPAMGTPGGAIGAGLGDLFREVGGGIGAMRAGNQLTGIRDQQDKGRTDFMLEVAKLLRKGTPRGAAPELPLETMGMGDLMPSGGGRYG